MTSPGPDSPEFHAYAGRLLADARNEVRQADAKASLLLAGAGVALGAVLSTTLTGRMHGRPLTDAAAWLWWAGVCAATAGVTFLGWAVCPRTRRTTPTTAHLVSYFGDVVARPKEALEERLLRTLRTPSVSLVDQIYEVSRIAATKYTLVRRALLLFGTAAVLCATALLVNLVG
ncbi:Pycsar system effector family protein [Streptomyces sp. NRRL S-37]|uniref:Pycsar system effector family protein n=1 Tax=Streptomyces sp. NRRL S-37 TaxID=1463903 RepID=UPI0006920A33|nr:Pycsar system effector family protein [Streptomyces sp. NRRL S-37]